MLLRPAAAVLGVGALGAAGAYLIGPLIMIAFFGRDYRVDGRLLAGLTLAAICLALLTLTGSAVLATSQHRAYAIGWFLSSVAAVAVLMTHLPLEIRSVLSLCVGPLVGIVIHLVAVRAASTADLDTGADDEP